MLLSLFINILIKKIESSIIVLSFIISLYYKIFDFSIFSIFSILYNLFIFSIFFNLYNLYDLYNLGVQIVIQSVFTKGYKL